MQATKNIGIIEQIREASEGAEVHCPNETELALARWAAEVVGRDDLIFCLGDSRPEAFLSSGKAIERGLLIQ